MSILQRLFKPIPNAQPPAARALDVEASATALAAMRPPEARGLENPAVPVSAQQLALLLGYGPTYAGIEVNEVSAMSLIAVFSAINILSESLAQLPLRVYRRVKDGVEEADTHPAWTMLTLRPSEEVSAFTWKQTTQGHVSGWGNGYSRIRWDNAGRPRELISLRPNRVKPVRRNGKLFYVYTPDEGGPETFDSSEIIHIHGLGFDGLVGYSPIYLARQAIGLGLATEAYAASFFGNGTTPGGVLEHPGKLGPAAANNLRESFNSMHQGVGRAFRMMVLEEGMKFNPYEISMEDAQLVALRKFTINEIASLFRVPPHMLAQLDRATHSNIEHQGIEFVNYTLGPWLSRYEEELTWKLFPQPSPYFVRFTFDDLVRADTKTRFEGHRVGIESGILSVNEARRKERLNPIEGGDEHLRPLNMTVIGAPPPPSKSQPPGADKPDHGEPDGDEEADPDDEPEPEGDAPRRMLEAKTAFMPLFVDAAERIIRKEAMAAERSGSKFKDAAALNAWLDKFYAEETPRIAHSLGLVGRSFCRSVGLEVRSTVADAYVSQHVAESRRQIVEAWQEGRLAELAEDWQVHRPAWIAGHLVDKIAEAL